MSISYVKICLNGASHGFNCKSTDMFISQTRETIYFMVFIVCKLTYFTALDYILLHGSFYKQQLINNDRPHFWKVEKQAFIK